MNIPQVASEVGPSRGNLGAQIGLIVILTLINAFFSAAEMALVSLDKNKLKQEAEEGDAKANKILNVLKDQSKFLSTIQVAITLAGFFNSAAAATGIAAKLGAVMEVQNIPYPYTLATIIITLILSYITIVLGELVPKRVALVRSEKFARNAIGVINFTSKLFGPFVKLLSLSTNVILKIFGISSEDVEERITINDIKSMLQIGQDQGIIDPIESDMINSVIGLDETSAEEIMTARPEVFTIDVNDSFDKYLDEMLNLKYSRIPVYEDDVDNIIGILYLKDYLLASYQKGFENVDIRSILKPAYFVPERKNINELFNDLQSTNRYMALLIDEYGGFSGIVTMEDLIEEIVGDIDDEYDHDEPEIEKINDEIFIARGSLSIKEMNTQLGSEVDEDSEDYDTLGGLVIYLLGHIPEDGETYLFQYEGLEIFVMDVKEKRVQEARLKRIPREDLEEPIEVTEDDQ